MNKIILKNKTTYTIEEGATLSSISIKASTFDEMKGITDSFTKENLSEVTFTTNDNYSGNYTNLEATEFKFVKNDDGTYLLTISLKERDKLEMRLEALEESQNTQNDAIAEMSETVYGDTTESEV